MALKDLLGRDNQYVIYGGSEVFIGDKTSNAAAGTLFSAGYTRGDMVFTPNMEVTDVDAEQSLSPVLTFVSGAKFQLEFELLQNTLQNMRLAMNQASACLTGAANGALLVINDPILEFLQVQFTAPGGGTGTTHAGTKIDTYVFWNCLLRMNGGLPFGKKTVQSLKCSLSILPDSTITGVPEYAKGLYGRRAVA